MLSNRKVMVLPGDGIGAEVISANLEIMDWLSKHKSLNFDVKEDLIGGAAYDVHGVPLTDETLSDAVDLTGPIKPLSGKIVLIRYNNDGTVLKKNISYSARAKRGSSKNPFIKQGDLISIKNSILGKTTGVIKEVTAPFIGIYSTKEIIEGFW